MEVKYELDGSLDERQFSQETDTVIRFEFFPDLPDKVRERVWRIVLGRVESRVVPIWYKDWRRGPLGIAESCLVEEERFMNMVPPPEWLYLCHDIRKLALDKYSLVLSGPAQKCPLYVDPLNDVLYFSGKYDFGLRDPIFNIRHLAFPVIESTIAKDVVERTDLDPCFMHILTKLHLFKNLRSLGFVLHLGPCRTCTLEVPDLDAEWDGLPYRGPLLTKLGLPFHALNAVKKAHPEFEAPPVLSVVRLVKDKLFGCGYGHQLV